MLDNLAMACLEKAKEMPDSLTWQSLAAHLHLESSELVEATRGKRGDVCEEAADVLFVLFSALAHHDVQVSDVISTLEKRVK